jgi:hypothetical protein
VCTQPGQGADHCVNAARGLVTDEYTSMPEGGPRRNYDPSVADLPDSWCVPVIRADFSGGALWEELQDEIRRPTEEGLQANVEFVEDQTLADLDETTLVAAFPRRFPSDYRHSVIFVVNAVTVSSAEHPLLVIDLHEEEGDRPFRCLPRQVQAIENNLSISNMDFFEFARAADADGIFRGF